MSPACTSTQVFRPKGPELFHFPRCGRRRTKWEGGTAGSERPDTTACRPWAMKEHSRNYSLLGLSAPVRRFDCAFLSWARFKRTQRLTWSINVLRGRSLLSSYCFPQLANASSVVDLGFSLTIKASTVTIFSGHTVLFQTNTRTRTLHA
jgi:hypothetical protein